MGSWYDGTIRCTMGNRNKNVRWKEVNKTKNITHLHSTFFVQSFRWNNLDISFHFQDLYEDNVKEYNQQQGHKNTKKSDRFM